MNSYEQWHVKALIDRFAREFREIMDNKDTKYPDKMEKICRLHEKYKTNPSTQDFWEEMY